jgi:FkbM family methyltransferase
VVSHAGRVFRNAFFSPGRRLFGLRFSRDYLRFAWRAARAWGSTHPGVVDLLGHRLEYSNQSHALFLVHEIFVNGAYEFTSPNGRPRVLDCGANIGAAVLFFKAFRPDARVIAFEPDPTTFVHLSRTIAMNGLKDVQAEEAALGEVDGAATFYYSESDPGSMTASVKPSWAGDTRREVRVVRLSSFVKEPVDFLKMDCGRVRAGAHAKRGAAHGLRQGPACLILAEWES